MIIPTPITHAFQQAHQEAIGEPRFCANFNPQDDTSCKPGVAEVDLGRAGSFCRACAQTLADGVNESIAMLDATELYGGSVK